MNRFYPPVKYLIIRSSKTLLQDSKLAFVETRIKMKRKNFSIKNNNSKYK